MIARTTRIALVVNLCHVLVADLSFHFASRHTALSAAMCPRHDIHNFLNLQHATSSIRQSRRRKLPT